VCDLQHGQRRLPVCGLAVHRGVLVSGSMDSTAKVRNRPIEHGSCVAAPLLCQRSVVGPPSAQCYSISSRQCRATLQHKLEHSVNSVDVDEGLVATASDDGTARLWEHGAAASKHVLQHAAEVNAVSLAADLVATGCHDRLVRLFAVRSGQLMRTLRGHGREVVAVCVRHGMVLSGAADAAVRVWLMEEEEAVAMLEGHSGAVNGLALAPGGSLIASASSDEVLVWQPVAAR
jgi:WD40 repeat protein